MKMEENKEPYFMFNVTVFSFCVLSDNHKVHIIMSVERKCSIKLIPFHKKQH